MNKKVLIISYYFPPMGMGGTQRTAKFAKYLPAAGWTPLVLTVKNIRYYAHDPVLLDDLGDTRIIRTGSLDPLRLLAKLDQWRQSSTPEKKPETQRSTKWKPNRWLKLLNTILGGWLCIPDTKILWLPFALSHAKKLIRDEKIDVIFTTSPPHSAHLLGWYLKKRFGVKWVADFRDEWTGQAQPNPTALHRGINRWLERRVLRGADHVIGICDTMMRHLQHKSGLPQEHFTTIYNGFDPADFADVREDNSSEKFTIVHCGAITPVSHPGYFFQGIAAWLQEYPARRNQLKLRFIGADLTGEMAELAAQYQLDELLEYQNYLSHPEAVRAVQQADVLVLMVLPNPKEEIITGKVFEYFAARTPILAIIPEGELAGMIRRTATGDVRPHSPKKIAAALEQRYQEFVANNQSEPNVDEIDKFARPALAHQLAEIFNQMTKGV